MAPAGRCARKRSAPWGGLPEALSGYGYDELYTTLRCWNEARALAWLSGWRVHHYGSRTFGPLGGNTTPALRRNLSRLLALMDAADLDRGRDPLRIIERLRDRIMRKLQPRLLAPGAAE